MNTDPRSVGVPIDAEPAWLYAVSGSSSLRLPQRAEPTRGQEMTIILRANCIGSLAAQALSNANSEIVGQVVNTFSNSFYLKTVSEELVFVTNRSLRSPITINLDYSANLERVVRPLEILRICDTKLHIGVGASIDLSGASSYSSRSSHAIETSHRFTDIGSAVRIVSFILRVIDTSQSVLDPHGIAHAGVVSLVSSGVMALRRSDTGGRFLEDAMKIVGLGSGFTPSGDDTLGGFLAVYNSFASAIGRAPILLDLHAIEERTSWISAKLLDHMQNVILDEQVRALIDSVIDEDELVLAFESLLPRGHSSGIDISVGAILAFGLIHDISLNERRTRTIADELGLSS